MIIIPKTRVYLEISDNITGNIKKNISNSLKDIKKILLEISKELDINDTISVGLFFIKNNEIQKLNYQTRNIDKITDVLSYPFMEYEEKKRFYLGDVFINVDFLEKTSISNTLSINTKMKFLIMHGLLHLIGYHHSNEINEIKMKKRESEIFDSLKIEKNEYF